MNVKPVTDEEFREYGKILEGYENDDLIARMKEISMPEEGTAYEPSISILEQSELYNEYGGRAYGGMPIQIGMCWGYNTMLNCLEYHRDSEVNIGEQDFVLLLAKQSEIRDGKLDTSLVKAFWVPAGVAVEVYTTTLHYAPCQMSDDGFRVAVILPRDTNTDKPVIEPVSEEDKWMTARNKWLLAHADSKEAHNGAHIGLVGDNIDIRSFI